MNTIGAAGASDYDINLEYDGIFEHLIDDELTAAFSCAGSFGTLGSFGCALGCFGCAGSAGTFGCGSGDYIRML